MPIDLYALKTFYVLGQTQNYTRCARRLHLTQSAVSHAIKRLERSLGVPLTHKSRRKFSLTGEGEILHRAAERVFLELDRAQEGLAGSRPTSQSLSVGATVEFGSTVLLKQMGPFLHDHPELQVSFHFSHRPLPFLLSDDLDVMIDCRLHSNPALERHSLFREQYVVVASRAYLRRHPVRKAKDLRACTVLSLDGELSWWNSFWLALPDAARPSLESVVEINHIRGLINAAAESIGVGLVPKYSVLDRLRDGSLVNVFPSLHLLEDRFYIYQKKSRGGLRKNRLIVAYLRNIHPSEFGN